MLAAPPGQGVRPETSASAARGPDQDMPMQTFVFAYHGGQYPTNIDTNPDLENEWNQWFKSLGGAVVDPGAPVSYTHTVSMGGIQDGSPNPSTGYSVIQAQDIDAACSIAQQCPLVRNANGSVEVSQVLPLVPM